MKKTVITGLSIYALLIAPLHAINSRNSVTDFISESRFRDDVKKDMRVIRVVADEADRYTFSVCESELKKSSCQKIKESSYSKDEILKKLKRENNFLIADKLTEGGTFAAVTSAGVYISTGLALGPVGAAVGLALSLLSATGLTAHVVAMNHRFGRSPAEHKQVMDILSSIDLAGLVIKDIDQAAKLLDEVLTEIEKERKDLAVIADSSVNNESRFSGKGIPKTPEEKREAIQTIGR